MAESAENESKFGFKNKEKAMETLELLESHDMQYRKLTVRGLLGRAKRVLSMTKAEEKIRNIKSAIEIFEKWLEENGGGASNKNSKTDVEDKVETVPGLGFKDKAAAEKTLSILKDRDPEYQKLAVKGLIGSSKRVLSGTKDEHKIKSIKEGVGILEDFLENFENNNLMKNNRAYLSYSLVEQLSKKFPPKDELAAEFIASYGGPKAKSNYKHLRTMFPKNNDSTSWDIVRNCKIAKLLRKIKDKEDALFNEADSVPTALHLELSYWAYSPQPEKLKSFVEKGMHKKREKRERTRSNESNTSSSNDGETPKKKQR